MRITSVEQSGENIKDEQGLVLSSKSDRFKNPTHTYTVSQYAGSIETTVKQHVNSDTPEWNGRLDRPIITFSKKSRNRMFQALAKMRVEWSTALFITLTYDGKFNGTPETVKRDISVFRKRLARKYPLSGGIWRMEIKRRLSGESEGEPVPHFHVILFGAIDDLGDIREWLSKAWNEIIGGSKSHLLAGTNCQRVNNRKHASYYVSKYAGKEEEEEFAYMDEHGEIMTWGRRWGVFGEVDQSEAITFKLTREEFVIFKRLLARWLRNKNRRYAKRVQQGRSTQGFTMFSFGDEDVGITQLSLIIRHVREIAGMKK